MSSNPNKRIKVEGDKLVDKSEWPEAFQELEKIHFRLNSYFTFLSSRKHVITTFDIVKSSAENVIKRPLTYHDVAKLLYLLPEDILFEYVDENQFLLEDKHFQFSKGYTQKDVDIYDLKNDEDEEKHSKQLLVFEFIDGNLKKSKTKTYFKTEVKLPVYTPESMKKLILRRNSKFNKVISLFLTDCQNKGIVDPMAELNTLSEKLIPKPKNYVDPVEAMLKNSLAANNDVKGLTRTNDRPSIPKFIEKLKNANFYKNQIVENGEFLIEPRPPKFGDLNFELSDYLWNALYNMKKIEHFYSHQAQALNAIHDGKNVIISTSTSSGKSLIYQVPVVKSLEEGLDIRSVFIFPTKALAQDQKRSLSELLHHIPNLDNIIIETFDGDTENSKRNYIKRNANVIFTNPDMLHTSILPSHRSWSEFLRRLRYVVVDELHMYKGLFGSHVALIMRRLRRICASLGNENLQFISCSATLKSPLQHMYNIFGVRDIIHVGEDGSPSGEKHLVVWNPPYLNPIDPRNGRESFIAESAKLIVELMLNNVRTIAFCVVRKVCELLMKEVRSRLEKMEKNDSIGQVMSYRGGYSPSDRRKIEAEMFNGNLKAIISTNALELGIDIGSLDAVLICGFPLSMANFKQQSGRAGRRNKDSLTLLVGSDDPVNQHYMKHPEELIKDDYQDLLLDFNNMLVLEGHIQCAAFEIPITNLNKEVEFFGNLENLRKIVDERLIFDKKDNSYHCHNRFLPWPPKDVSIRAIEEDMYAVVDITNGRNTVIEEIEASRTSFTLYDGGIFIHQGYPYLVKEFNPDAKYAKVERCNVDWTTSQRDFTNVDPVEIELIRNLATSDSDVPIYFGKIETTIVVFGFFKIDKQKRILDAVEVHNPPIIIKSKGLWIDIPKQALEMIESKQLNSAAGIHAAEHVIMTLLPLFIVSGADEIQTECKAPEKEFAERQTARKRPARLIFYDAKAGQFGSGLSTKAFEHIDDILQESLEKLKECECDWGCPECCAAPFCKENSLVLSKPAAIIIISLILGVKINLDGILSGPEPTMPDVKIETIVPVSSNVKFSKDLEIIEVKKVASPFKKKSKTAEVEETEVMEAKKEFGESEIKIEDSEAVEEDTAHSGFKKNDGFQDEFGDSDDEYANI
ncbi:hypothetical protein PACTADRAFT_49872 [Pachysolen tannophilus NRRL Y-2460]|uniref:RNA helicase n=1 Tax=Pachysolen tannophilus NRRL Y-2460 TaxID=669874 RepID=A0A1E4TTR9_PACTA|nr:hypothetical protein PACTADRAFT_49872 [Pachysolen tannophilus NRRL Y-2460]